ncbi:MAG: ATP-binding protein, partial [Acidobacteriota bacterium]
DWLRLTLAQTADDAGAAATPGDATADVTWRLLFDHLDEGAALIDHEGHVRAANPALVRLFGFASVNSAEGTHLLDVLPEGSSLAPADATSGPPTLTTTIRTGDGLPVPLDLQFFPAGRGPGAPVFMTVRDRTWRQTAEDTLRDNRDLAEQLRRSQKIGALGRLAGGVAHDFNNLLQVIGGYAEALGADSLDLASRRRLLRRIQRATDRAASLTRQLLAFGRRQVLVPQVLDLNVTVLSLEHMLTRVIGEDVQFVSSLAPDLRRVKVDPGQIEQVVLNLALNSRDAMPDGGTLEIATANFVLPDGWSHPALPVTVPAGAWVLISVLDTGSGMDPETANQAFEPFFTTKDASRGSGLGLSMVYGIVKQSGGYTWIETAPGAGTSVHVLLPAVDEEAPAAQRDDPAGPARPETPGGTVLLVEDDPEVRSLFSAFLRDGGYAVVEAADGQEALETFERQADAIDVVMTDVVMPNVSGPALVSALRARRPNVRVLYVSGYTEPLELGGPEPNTIHLAKPVTRGALLKHLAALLGGANPSA